MSMLLKSIKSAQYRVSVSQLLSEDERLYQAALIAVRESMDDQFDDTQSPDVSDKGLFGGRRVEFKQEVYRIDDQRGDDQPTGLLTQKDLTEYIAFRKGDRLTFKYKSGTSGACVYDVRLNGQSEYSDGEYQWTDSLIQELIDEGAADLI